ncbi:hypothetical protein BC628DRAFT_948540 [Trametes gibbosa]|nr:hypothetical protein BC628DRAFT_948540 [Trametes gibbosa]
MDGRRTRVRGRRGIGLWVLARARGSAPTDVHALGLGRKSFSVLVSGMFRVFVRYGICDDSVFPLLCRMSRVSSSTQSPVCYSLCFPLCTMALVAVPICSLPSSLSRFTALYRSCVLLRMKITVMFGLCALQLHLV